MSGDKLRPCQAHWFKQVPGLHYDQKSFFLFFFFFFFFFFYFFLHNLLWSLRTISLYTLFIWLGKELLFLLFRKYCVLWFLRIMVLLSFPRNMWKDQKNKEVAYILKGFSAWEKTPKCFYSHQDSACHQAFSAYHLSLNVMMFKKWLMIKLPTKTKLSVNIC